MKREVIGYSMMFFLVLFAQGCGGGLSVDYGEIFNLQFGGSASLKDTQLKVSFVGVVDERCETDVECSASDAATVTLKVVKGEASETREVVIPSQIGEGVALQSLGYEFWITQLLPAASGQVINEKDYQLELKIAQGLKLGDAYWTLVSIQSAGSAPEPVLYNTDYFLSFEEDMVLKGRKPCNRLWGTYQQSANVLEVFGLTSTSNSCEHPQQAAMDSQIAVFESTIVNSDNYGIGNNKLTIESSTGDRLMFSGTRKSCQLDATRISLENYNMCLLTCNASVLQTLSCLGGTLERQCAIYCSINELVSE